MRTGYLSLVGGASGDMLLGALLDAGLDKGALEAELAKIDLPPHRIVSGPAQRGGVHGTRVSVEIDREDAPHDWADFHGRVDGSSLPHDVKRGVIDVLQRLAEAERRAHRRAPEDPPGPLHELGSLDTLIDTVGVVSGLRLMGIERLYSSPLPLGGGVVVTGHGPLPAAAPATLELAALARAPVTAPPDGAAGELVTPTGAALITALAEFRQPPMRLEAVGYGLGTREMPAVPNVVALWVGDSEEQPVRSLTLLETNIDDASPQVLAYAQERLFALGALDVWSTPIQMKKGRSGTMLSVLLLARLEDDAVSLLFRETTTLGVRRRDVERHEAARELLTIQTTMGAVPVKAKRLDGRIVAVAPEYDACRALALERRLPLREVLAQVEREAWEQLAGREGTDV